MAGSMRCSPDRVEVLKRPGALPSTSGRRWNLHDSSGTTPSPSFLRSARLIHPIARCHHSAKQAEGQFATLRMEAIQKRRTMPLIAPSIFRTPASPLMAAFW